MIFLLPNKPKLPSGISHYFECSVDEVIALNGNHWRKILTIIAKLCAKPDEDWRIVRDQYIWQRCNLIFSYEDLAGLAGWLFIVGKTFSDVCPTPSNAKVLGNDKHFATRVQERFWVPYLDYRQFPNTLIDTIRDEIYRD